MHELTSPNSAVPRPLFSHVQKAPYILPEAREAYVHWWTQQTYWALRVWSWETHEKTAQEIINCLYPHLWQPTPRRPRYRREHRRDLSKYVFVTVRTELPDGSLLEHTWPHEHGAYKRWEAKDFRVRRPKKAEKAQEKHEKTQIRREKEREYRKRHETYGRRQFWANAQNRWDRREARELIRKGDYDRIRTIQEPRDRWLWD
jgi:hypothetical protein